MNESERKEIINAARSHERAIAEKRRIFREIVRLSKEGKPDGYEQLKKEFYGPASVACSLSEKLLASRVYAEWVFVRVDDVIYKPINETSVVRIPLADIPDIAVTPDLAVSDTA
jgi:hypothetical protein